MGKLYGYIRASTTEQNEDSSMPCKNTTLRKRIFFATSNRERIFSDPVTMR